MNPSARKGTETVNAEGQRDRRVDTVDYQSSVGQSQEQRPVQVVHQTHSETVELSTSGGVLAGAAAAVASTLQSAREAISGNDTTSNNSTNR